MCFGLIFWEIKIYEIIMILKKCIFIGVLIDSGKCWCGCLMGFDVLCIVGFVESFFDLGYEVMDLGNVIFDVFVLIVLD